MMETHYQAFLVMLNDGEKKCFKKLHVVTLWMCKEGRKMVAERRIWGS